MGSFTFVLEHAFPSQPLKMSNVPVRPLTPTSTEKHDPVELEQAPTSKSVDSGHNDIDPEFSPDEERRIVRRIDRRLIVTCGLMYCISLMDRTNLSNAAIAGMVVELNLIGFRYSTIALVFFATYTLCQPPATVMCRKIGPRPFLASVTLAWGIVMIGFGFPETWGPMIPLRLILGVLEAGFFPGCVYLISTWYTRYELQKRYSIFYLIGCLASACSGILAYGLMQMDGLADYSGWRWIFIMEGILTCVVGIIGYLFLVDFPDRAAKTSWAFLKSMYCLKRLSSNQPTRSNASHNLLVLFTSMLVAFCAAVLVKFFLSLIYLTRAMNILRLFARYC